MLLKLVPGCGAHRAGWYTFGQLSVHYSAVIILLEQCINVAYCIRYVCNMSRWMNAKKQRTPLPLGRAALLALQLNSLRDECCEAAEKLCRQKKINESELDECARLDDALAEAQRVLKSAVASIAESRLRRRSRVK